MRSFNVKAVTRPKVLVAAAILITIGTIALVVWNKPLVAAVKAATYQPHTRTYYVAAENVDWNYAPGGRELVSGQAVPAPWGNQLVYHKTRYIQYTDASFTTQVPQPAWQGILGPTIRGVVGDTIKVVFYNKATKDYSMHPHGLAYTKDNEGSVDMMQTTGGDFDGDSGADMSQMSMPGMDMPAADADGDGDEHRMSSTTPGVGDMGAGAKVAPGGKYTYVWTVRPEAGPTGTQSSRVWLYHSHVDLHDIYDGLVGAIVITNPAHATKDAKPDDVPGGEFISLFMIFNESTPGMTADEQEAATKHTINGRFFDTLQGYELTKGEKSRWYVMGLGNEVDLHTPHWHGNDVTETSGQTTDVISLLPASMQTVDMTPDNEGIWMFHCHVVDHMNAGMMATYIVGVNHS
jgi:FtsP/CotA-like multicopper oxidase with cupredoxin domain